MKQDEMNKLKIPENLNDYEKLHYLMGKTFEIEEKLWKPFIDAVRKEMPHVGMVMGFSIIDESTGIVHIQEFQYGDYDALTEFFYHQASCKSPARAALKIRIRRVLEFFFRDRREAKND